MTDLLQSLPDFPTNQFSHLLPSLDKHNITLGDLLTLDAANIARKAQVPPGEVRKLTDAALRMLHGHLGLKDDSNENDSRQQEQGESNKQEPDKWQKISTLSPTIDEALGGGVPIRYLTELVGESGAGKTQFLLTLLLSVQLPPSHGGLEASSVYISTESALSTQRLSQLLRSHPRLASIPQEQQPSLNRILTLQTPDLESQEHILRYQLPVAIQRHGVKLVVIDSIAANYRAEFERRGPKAHGPTDTDARRAGAGAMAARRAQLLQLGALLRALAHDYGVAIVVANQVADRFGADPLLLTLDEPAATYVSQEAHGGRIEAGSAPAVLSQQLPAHHHQHSFQQHAPPPAAEPMTLDHQQRFFTGWGDVTAAAGGFTQLKTPSLGLVWANQIAARIALIRYQTPVHGLKRYMRLVFCPWAACTQETGVEYEIWEGGVRGLADGVADEDSGNSDGEEGSVGQKRKRDIDD